jgi:hypothetical protein
MLKTIVIGLGVILAVAALVVALQPAAFAIERSALIQAPAGVIYPHIASLRAMNQWSPFAQGDPQMKIVYEGPDGAVGSSSAWDSKQMGKGKMIVTGLSPDRQVDLRLEFLSPYEATNTAKFVLAAEGSATRVTWRMEGTNGFLGKAFGLVMNTEKMVGGQFEKGLASIQTLTEAEVSQRAAR